MKRQQRRRVRYLCPECLASYEAPEDDLNETIPACLNCGSPLIKSKRKPGDMDEGDC